MGRQKRDGNHSPPKNNLIQVSIPDPNKTKINGCQEHPQRRNPASNHGEFHGDVTRHGQPKRIRGTQEIPRHQK
jgi:hypothetical protein